MIDDQPTPVPSEATEAGEGERVCASCGRAGDDERGWTVTMSGPLGIVCPRCFPAEPDAGEVASLRLAISDPGATTPRLPNENVTAWSARAVLASPALAALLAVERGKAWDEAAEEVPTSTGYSSGVPVWRSEVREWLLERNPYRADREATS